MSLIFNKGSDCRQICNTIPELLSKNLVDAAGGGRREAGGGRREVGGGRWEAGRGKRVQDRRARQAGRARQGTLTTLKTLTTLRTLRSWRGVAEAVYRRKKATDILRGFQTILQVRYLFAVRNSTSDLRPTTRLSYSRRPVPPGIRCPQMTFSLRFSNGSTFA